MTTSGGPSLVRRCAVYAISLTLGTGGTLLTWWAAQQSLGLATPVHLHWLWLLPAYVAVLRFPLTFQVGREKNSSTLTQVPMAVGLVLVAPWLHLAARTGAGLVDVCRRRPPVIKAIYNVAMAAAETGIATAAFALLVRGDGPGPGLWVPMFAALVLVDAFGMVPVNVVLRLMGASPTLRQVLSTAWTNLGSSTAFASLGVVAVACAWTDIWTLPLLAVMAGAMGVGFRRHRTVSDRAQQQVELQQFLAGLGPLDMTSKNAHETFSHLRRLLRADEIEIALSDEESGLLLVDSDAGSRVMRRSEAPQSASDLDQDALGDQISATLTSEGVVVGAVTLRGKHDHQGSFDLRDQRLLDAVAADLGAAMERGHLQRELAKAATTDALTGLPNLNEFQRLLDERLEDSATSWVLAAVAVDSFREVNDTLGHEVGDGLLLEVTRRLRGNYPEALLARIGGGRFALVVDADRTGHDPAMFGLGVRAQVEGGAQLGPVGTHIRLSVGCVMTPEHGTDAATLVRRAETAMYSARVAHGGPVIWEPVYEIQGQRRLAVVMALREALSSGAIGVAFQPKVSADAKQVTGVEALARWTHPALGAISPAEFVPLAEAAGLMGPLTSSVLRQALTACKGWQRRGGRIGVAVNVSADTILDAGFVTEVAAILTSISIAPDLLTLELTEGVVVHDPELAKQRLGEMRALGVKISVDDFGTGYSSLTYLKGLPVDEVKIDKGFVNDVTHDAGDRAVVRAVVDIAHTLGLRVVAEGVEHPDQGEVLAALGVDEVQGYLHARPMAALDMAQWLRRREGIPAQHVGDDF